MTINKNLVDGRCKICGYDLEARPAGGLFKSRPADRRLVKEYCNENSDYRHKLKPVWKKCCDSLDYYLVTLKNKDIPLRKRKIWKE